MGIRNYAAAGTAAVVLVALSVHSAEAQQGLELGLRGGVSVSSASLDVSETFSKSNRTGFAGGAFLNYDAVGALGFQIAAEYVQKGVDVDLVTSTDKFQLDYVEIPVVVKLGLPLVVVKPSVFGGASVAFLTNCDLDGLDCSDAFKTVDYAGIVGADVAFYLGRTSLWADGRYHVGLHDIHDVSDVIGNFKTRNWTFQAGVGFRLRQR